MAPSSVDRSTSGDPYIFRALQERIESGEYRPGAWLPAERALAREFSVDRYAVRNALLRLEKQGLIVREPGRRPWVRPQAPPKRAQTERPERSLRTIMAIIGQHTLNFNSLDILRGINAVLLSKEAPYRLLVFDTATEHAATVALEKQALRIVEEEGVSGAIVVHNGGLETVADLRRLQDRGTPLVFVDRFPAGMRCDFVGVDNFTGAQEAVHHLLQLGHRRIAHLTTQEPLTTVLRREEGYRAALLSESMTVNPGWIHRIARVRNSADLRPALDQFFGLAEPPTAVFAINDLIAHFFMIEAEARGLAVPEAISVVGFDNYDRYSPRQAVLTTVEQPFEQIGRRAAELLLDRLASKDPASLPYQHVLLPTRLVVRATCRPPARESGAAVRRDETG